MAQENKQMLAGRYGEWHGMNVVVDNGHDNMSGQQKFTFIQNIRFMHHKNIDKDKKYILRQGESDIVGVFLGSEIPSKITECGNVHIYNSFTFRALEHDKLYVVYTPTNKLLVDAYLPELEQLGNHSLVYTEDRARAGLELGGIYVKVFQQGEDVKPLD
jgi:hypothetical protein